MKTDIISLWPEVPLLLKLPSPQLHPQRPILNFKKKKSKGRTVRIYEVMRYCFSVSEPTGDLKEWLCGAPVCFGGREGFCVCVCRSVFRNRKCFISWEWWRKARQEEAVIRNIFNFCRIHSLPNHCFRARGKEQRGAGKRIPPPFDSVASLTDFTRVVLPTK